MSNVVTVESAPRGRVRPREIAPQVRMPDYGFKMYPARGTVVNVEVREGVR